MPHYCFDIEDGHGLVDPSGSDCKNEAAAFEKAKVLAIGDSLDKPEVDPTRRISVPNADRAEISSVPVYSKPQSDDIALMSARLIQEASRLFQAISLDRVDRNQRSPVCGRQSP
jgi:hypothetical protein